MARIDDELSTLAALPDAALGALAEPRSTREMVPASSERSLRELGNEQLSAPYRQKAQEEALGAG